MALRSLVKASTVQQRHTTLVVALVDARIQPLATTMQMLSLTTTTVLALALLKVHATATETLKMHSASAEAHVPLMRMLTAFATMWTIASVNLTHVEFAMATTRRALDAMVFQTVDLRLTIAESAVVTTAAAQVVWMKQPATTTQMQPFKVSSQETLVHSKLI
tara:strand:- start:9285 stop:9773 length:489 start_codon:yes stop_codon:yes gene_type:complete